MIIIGIFVALFILIIFLIKPRKGYLITEVTDMFAHRGLHTSAIPENSISAFKNAAAHRLGVELDIQLTSDNKVVVFHDNDLFRMCGDDKKISDYTYDELLSFHLLDTQEKIPLFKDVLKIMDGLPIICELKIQGKANNTKICDYAIDMIKNYKGEIYIESFSPFIVSWFKIHNPEIIRGQLAYDFKPKDTSTLNGFLLKNLFMNFISRPDFIAYKYTDDSFGYRLCRHIFKPHNFAWTPKGETALNYAKNKEYFNAYIFEIEE